MVTDINLGRDGQVFFDRLGVARHARVREIDAGLPVVLYDRSRRRWIGPKKSTTRRSLPKPVLGGNCSAVSQLECGQTRLRKAAHVVARAAF